INVLNNNFYHYSIFYCTTVTHHLEGGTKSAPALNTLKLLGTAPAYVYRWCIHPYIVQPVVAFEHKPCLPVLSHQRSRFLIAPVESGCPSHPVPLSGAQAVHKTRYDF
ncbi:conserved hypothetical protein, partial [Trichinella spiralis]|uniref:hypothetical protein n=1 Tax=Trichinella spiralis TaxID=6334 RepID=UPI0001EFEB29